MLNFPNHVLYRGIMVLRAILRKPNGIDQSECRLWESILDLQYERSDKSVGSGFKFDAEILATFRSYFKMKGLNEDDIDWIRVNGAIDVNAFSIERVEGEGEQPS